MKKKWLKHTFHMPSYLSLDIDNIKWTHTGENAIHDEFLACIIDFGGQKNYFQLLSFLPILLGRKEYRVLRKKKLSSDISRKQFLPMKWFFDYKFSSTKWIFFKHQISPILFCFSWLSHSMNTPKIQEAHVVGRFTIWFYL